MRAKFKFNPRALLTNLKGIKLKEIIRPDIKIKDTQKAQKAKKTTILTAVILLILLTISVGFGTKKKQTDDQQNQQQQVIAPALQAIETSKQLAQSDPLQAKNILNQTKQELLTAKQSSDDKELIIAINDAMRQVETQLAAVTGIRTVAEPELYLDLSLIKEEIKAKTMTLGSGRLVISSPDSNDILLIDLVDKNHERISWSPDQGKLAEAALINEGRWLAIFSDKMLSVQAVANGNEIQSKENDWGGGITGIGYESNYYLLQNNEIQKFIGLDDGLSNPRPYLKDSPSWDGKDLAVDGFVWVLGDDGHVYKYISGKRDSFVMLGMEELSSDLQMYTDKALDHIYLLDRQNTKVYQLDKSGEYQQSYLWPGLAGVVDFVVSEENGYIYLLTADRIYTIGLAQ